MTGKFASLVLLAATTAALAQDRAVLNEADVWKLYTTPQVSFMDAAGDRWWPFSGAVTFLHAIKRVRGMRVITPRWAQRAGSKQLAAVRQKQENQAAARVIPFRRKPLEEQ